MKSVFSRGSACSVKRALVSQVGSLQGLEVAQLKIPGISERVRICLDSTG